MAISSIGSTRSTRDTFIIYDSFLASLLQMFCHNTLIHRQQTTERRTLIKFKQARFWRKNEDILPSCTKDHYKISMFNFIISILCNNSIIVLLFYRTTHSLWVCKFFLYFSYFYTYYHICVCHVSITFFCLL